MHPGFTPVLTSYPGQSSPDHFRLGRHQKGAVLTTPPLSPFSQRKPANSPKVLDRQKSSRYRGSRVGPPPGGCPYTVSAGAIVDHTQNSDLELNLECPILPVRQRQNQTYNTLIYFVIY